MCSSKQASIMISFQIPHLILAHTSGAPCSLWAWTNLVGGDYVTALVSAHYPDVTNDRI